MQGHFLEEGDRENLERCVERGVQVETLLDDGDEDVDIQAYLRTGLINPLPDFPGPPRTHGGARG